MIRNSSYHGACLALLALAIGGTPGRSQHVDSARYAKADRIRTVMMTTQVGGVIHPTWLPDSVRFYFRSNDVRDRGAVYLVDPTSGTKVPLFDNRRMAAQLSLAAAAPVDAAALPPFMYVERERLLEFRFRGQDYKCGIDRYACVAADTLDRMFLQVMDQGPSWAIRSPDKRWDAFILGQNLYIRPAEMANMEAEATRDSLQGTSARATRSAPSTVSPLPPGSIQLTTDGTRYYTYGSSPSQQGRGVIDTLTSRPVRPQALSWSPDSRKLVTFRHDARYVRRFPLYSVSGLQPRDVSYPYAVPGDSIVPEYDIFIFDVASHSGVKVKDTPIIDAGHTLFEMGGVRWGRTAEKLFVLHTVRGAKRVTLARVDTRTGERTIIARDSVDTYIEVPSWDVVNDGADIIWYSQRDGWPHYYLYSESEGLKNQITSGEYAVNMWGLARVDGIARQLYVSASGREPGNPYFSHLYRVNFDGTGITHLTPEPATHKITFVPRAEYFIDEYSRPDQPAVTVLRSAQTGEAVLELARGDDSPLREIGWTPGEVFTTKARDGATDLWGIMYKPSDFDPAKSYPIITNPRTSGPLIGSVPSWEHVGASPLSWALSEPRALAELGFVVIQLNYLGTAGRSKAFHDYSVGDMGNAGLPDDMSGIRQLAVRYTWVDSTRVGVYGLSVGGLAAASAILRYPDFYKVAVATVGNHDQRTYGFFWGERYQGMYERDAEGRDNYESAANSALASNLKGNLLLMHGLVDRNTHPAHTFGLVQALIEADKDFDLVIFPRGGHELPDYGVRKKWDYFVQHLLGVEPPRGYRMIRTH